MSLKKLSLYEIDGLTTLSITSTSLEDLSVRSCFRKVKFVTISAAKLHTLSIYTGFLWKTVTMNIGDECVRTFNFVGQSNCKFSKSFMEIDTVSIDHVDPYKFDCISLLGTLQAVCHCRVLNLDTSLLEELCLSNGLDVFFGNVQELVIRFSYLTSDMEIGKFLRGFPKLTSLFVKINRSVELSREILDLYPSKETKFTKEGGDSENIFLNYLKVVEIETHVQTNGHIKSVDYLMKQAVCLEKVIIVYVKT